MADHRPQDAQRLLEGNDHRQSTRRRKVMLGIGLLLCVVVACVAAIVTMLQRLETRNATFQPPMTALERQRLLPKDPVLDAAPRLEGLRYGDQVEIKAAEFSPVEDQAHDEHPPLSHAMILQTQELHADTHSDLHPARQTR